jgi:4-hydroxybenzoate polyprenyltransferase
MRYLRQSMWAVAVAGLVLGSLAMVGGTAVGGQIGPMIIGYGLLVALSALYLVAGLAIRERAWRRLAQPMTGANPDRLAGRRVF